MNSVQWRNSKEYKDIMQKEKNRQRKLCAKILLKGALNGVLGGAACAAALAIGGPLLLLAMVAWTYVEGGENG